MHRSILGIIGVMVTVVWAEPLDETVKKANQLFEARKGDEAKLLYEQAAQAGSVEAHFALAYQYILPPDQSISNLVYAAEKGHGEALECALDDLLFRAADLRRARPQMALELYRKAKQANPEISLYDETNTVSVLEMCAELPEFDVEAFITTYNLTDEEVAGSFYSVWELAEEASTGGRFGKPDPELVFQLVARGGSVPMELMYAVKDFHAAWKAGEVREFKIDDYVTSGVGMGFCASAKHEKLEQELSDRLDALAKRQDPKLAKLLIPSRYAAFYFIECNVHNAEVHGGSGRAAWMLNSMMEQKTAYVDMMEKAAEGWTPQVSLSLDDARNQLAELLWKLDEALRDPDLERSMFSPYPEAVQIDESQRVWEKYADATLEYTYVANPKSNRDLLMVWLLEQRIEQLEELSSLLGLK